MTPSMGCPVLQIRVTMYVSSNEVDIGERDPLLERTHTAQVYPLVTTVQVYGVVRLHKPRPGVDAAPMVRPTSRRQR